MELIQAVVLAFVQGVTEFLPISSTAHLILIPAFSDWPDHGLAFDVAMNTATWLAVLIYFRSDIKALLKGFLKTLRERSFKGNHDGALAWMVLFATVPVGLAGLLAHDLVAGKLRTVEVIAVSSILWGVVLFAADRRPGSLKVEGIKWPAAIFVGIAQAVALIPGTSRSGITITAGLFAGLSRVAAARFSFLLAVIVGALAGASEGADMLKSGSETPWGAVIIGFLVAFLSSYLAIHYFLKIISRASMTPFVAYRVALGVLLLLLLWGGHM